MISSYRYGLQGCVGWGRLELFIRNHLLIDIKTIQRYTGKRWYFLFIVCMSLLLLTYNKLGTEWACTERTCMTWACAALVNTAGMPNRGFFQQYKYLLPVKKINVDYFQVYVAWIIICRYQRRNQCSRSEIIFFMIYFDLNFGSGSELFMKNTFEM